MESYDRQMTIHLQRTAIRVSGRLELPLSAQNLAETAASGRDCRRQHAGQLADRADVEIQDWVGRRMIEPFSHQPGSPLSVERDQAERRRELEPPLHQLVRTADLFFP